MKFRLIKIWDGKVYEYVDQTGYHWFTTFVL